MQLILAGIHVARREGHRDGVQLGRRAEERLHAASCLDAWLSHERLRRVLTRSASRTHKKVNSCVQTRSASWTHLPVNDAASRSAEAASKLVEIQGNFG